MIQKILFSPISAIIAIIIFILFVFLWFRKQNKETSEIIQSAILLVLAFTMLFVAQQTSESRRSADLMRYSIEVQNQPYIALSDFVYIHQGSNLNLSIIGNAQCYGTTPAHNFKQTNNLLFDLTLSENQLDMFFKRTAGEEPSKIKFYFYRKKLREKILEYIEQNPSLTDVDLKKYLKTFKTNPPKISGTVDGVSIDTELRIDDYEVYGDIREWLSPPRILPPGIITRLKTGRLMHDVLPDISKKMLLYYCATEYEGLIIGKKFGSFYYGFIDMTTPVPVKVKDSGGYERDGFLFITEKTWSTRNQLPK